MVDSSKKTRKATHLKAFTVSRLGGARVAIDIDPQTGRASGPNHAQFVNYLGVLNMFEGIYFGSRLGL